MYISFQEILAELMEKSSFKPGGQLEVKCDILRDDCSLNIMLRFFSTPVPESSQFILKLQFSDPRRAPGELLLLLVPLHTETPIKKYILFRGT